MHSTRLGGRVLDHHFMGGSGSIVLFVDDLSRDIEDRWGEADAHGTVRGLDPLGGGREVTNVEHRVPDLAESGNALLACESPRVTLERHAANENAPTTAGREEDGAPVGGPDNGTPLGAGAVHVVLEVLRTCQASPDADKSGRDIRLFGLTPTLRHLGRVGVRPHGRDNLVLEDLNDGTTVREPATRFSNLRDSGVAGSSRVAEATAKGR